MLIICVERILQEHVSPDDYGLINFQGPSGSGKSVLIDILLSVLDIIPSGNKNSTAQTGVPIVIVNNTNKEWPYRYEVAYIGPADLARIIDTLKAESLEIAEASEHSLASKSVEQDQFELLWSGVSHYEVDRKTTDEWVKLALAKWPQIGTTKSQEFADPTDFAAAIATHTSQ